MADATISVPNTGTAPVDVESLTVGVTTVSRQRMEIAGASALEIARIINTTPAGTEYALVTRPIPSGSYTVAQGTAANLLATATQGPANTLANAWPTKITDGTSVAAVKAASTATAAADPSVVVALSPNSPLPTGTNTIGSAKVTDGTNTLTMAAKGTQASTAAAVQDLKDAGRTPIILSVAAVASVASETAFTMNIWKGGTTTTGTTYSVTAGKTFRIQSIQFGSRFTTNSTTVTFASVTFRIRMATSGTATTTSPLVLSDSKMAAANLPTPNSDLPIPDGLEIPAGYSIMVTQQGSATTLSLDFIIVGYEY